MTSTPFHTPFPALPLDVLVNNELTGYLAVGNLGEAFLANLLKAELAPLRQAHQEGVDVFHEVLCAALDEVGQNRADLADDDLGRDMLATAARTCVVLAYGTEHRLFPHLMAYIRHRLGRHMLVRPNLVRDVMAADPTFAGVMEKSLTQLADLCGGSPMELLVPPAEPVTGTVQCEFCDRSWTEGMAKLQVFPADFDPIVDDDSTSSTRENVMELSGAFYQVSLDGSNPLQNVCCHDHVVEKLIEDRCAMFDPWLGELAVGFLAPEQTAPLAEGWKRYGHLPAT
jgi:hypothetical protein